MSDATPHAEFTTAQLLADRPPGPWWEFFRVPALSMGVYTLDAGAADEQQPHTEDEVYLVLEGRGVLRVDGEDVPAVPGALLYVAANVEHRFHSIEEQLRLLVVFAPAEYSRAGAR